VFRCAPFLLLLAVPALAADEKPTDAEAALIKLVEKLGGKAKLNDELDADSRVAVVFEKVSDADLLALSKHASLGSLDLRSADKVTAKGFAALKELPDLQRLYIGAAVAADEAAAIGTLRPLTLLVLAECKLTDAEVARFARLKNLKSLDLMGTAVTDKSVDTLLALTKLEELNLSGTRITDAGVKKLLALEALRQLHLSNTKVTAAAIGEMEDELKSSRRGLKIVR
jgi:internalin A